tara:strand:- start:345 stop:650 length:306 start_codon:yes stop_codon:yes gene_type:complete
VASLHHNVTGELTTELLAAGDNFILKSISLANVHGTTKCSVDLFIQKKLTGRFYFFKQLSIPADSALVYETSFDNGASGFALFIKLTKSASETPAVDVIIS